jgi:signal peptidase I
VNTEPLTADPTPLHRVRVNAQTFVWSLLVPAALAVVVLRALVPTVMAAPGGAMGALARLGSEHPLLVALGLFIVISQTIHYWRTWQRPAVREVASPRTVARTVAALGLAAVAALGVRTFVASTHRVTGLSMLPGLNGGDRLLVNRMAYGLRLPFSEHRLGAKVPKRGDIVVLRAGENAGGAPAGSLVKRVIGLPGDRIAIHNGEITINDWRIPYCDAGPFVHVSKSSTVQGRLSVEFLDNQTFLTVRNFGERGLVDYTVQRGEVFVVGDDRGLSNDSRVWNGGRGGGVRLENIEGKVTRILAHGRPDGGFDLRPLLSRPGLGLRQPGVDLGKTREWIGNCLREPPPSAAPATNP